ncbi:MAG: hypothetical protein CL666_03535 [Balneola sp.]|nr:hypothetical protein [Balneola sp.]|tara:strand:- start:21260 stop:21769 length:510 start_codon:yes stop_codon:yes gene_type:complete
MKVAITDACIFIDLLESEACTAFFQLPLDIVTTRQVWGELESEQKAVLQQWIKTKDLSIIEVQGTLEILRTNYKLSVRLSIADLSVWSVCQKEGGVLLTSDGTLRKMARENNIDTHGLLWVFDQIVKNKLLTVIEATEKLQSVFNQNEYYKADVKLFDAYEEMITKWQN